MEPAEAMSQDSLALSQADPLSLPLLLSPRLASSAAALSRRLAGYRVFDAIFCLDVRVISESSHVCLSQIQVNMRAR